MIAPPRSDKITETEPRFAQCGVVGRTCQLYTDTVDFKLAKDNAARELDGQAPCAHYADVGVTGFGRCVGYAEVGAEVLAKCDDPRKLVGIGAAG